MNSRKECGRPAREVSNESKGRRAKRNVHKKVRQFGRKLVTRWQKGEV